MLALIPPALPAISPPADRANDRRPAPRELRVWLVDDEISFREMLGEYLDTLPGVRVAGHSGDRAELMAAVHAGRVDLVVLDLMLGETGGMTVMQELAALPVPPAVLFLSATASPHAVLLAAHFGARGFVEKNAPLKSIELALRRIAKGGAYFSAGPRRILAPESGPRGGRAKADETSRRELCLLVALLNECPIREAADQLHLSLSSTYKVRSQLMAKAAAQNNRDLQAYAASIGLSGSRTAW